MLQKFYVYITTNLITKKQYIGSHKGFIEDSYLGSGKLLLNSIKKHGRNNFNREILEEAPSKEEAFSLEEIYIQNYKTLYPDGYNLSPKGGLGVPNCFSEESKQKISNSNKGKKTWLGKKHSEESKEKIRQKTNVSGSCNPFFGKKHSTESKKLISQKSAWNRGISLSESHKENIGKSHIGLSPSEETRNKIGKKLKGRIPWNKGLKITSQ
jgi:group I intron endonuclease